MNIFKTVFAYSFRLVLVLILAAVVRAEVHLPSIIGDNMVLQRGMKVRIWGTANARERVTVTFDKNSAHAVADAQGRWEVWLGPLKPGAPSDLTGKDLTVKGDNTLTIKNVLVGEVWICSGQSNMEWPLSNTDNAAATLAEARYPEIRLFTVEKKTSTTPLSDVTGHWVVTTPEEAAHFSAVGYFFGRELYQHLKTPIGLIHTSWGGTPAEAWTSHEGLLSSPELKPILDKYESSMNALPQTKEAYARAMAKWEEDNLYVDRENKGEALGYALPNTSTSDWSKMDLPKQFETAGLTIDGAVWFRREVVIPDTWVGGNLILNLPAIDDYDTTYFNGKVIGTTGRETPDSYQVPRMYMVPGSLVHEGTNVIAVRVFDRAGEGGFGRGDMSLRSASRDLSSPITLRGSWDYKVELALEPKHVDWGTRPEPVGAGKQNSPSVLYNAMLAPLVPFAIRGTIWYQGESNAGRAYQYRTLFPIMIRDWRRAWGRVFPFYFVQLANWRPRKDQPAESDWAELREAQSMTLREPQTGMAVAIDIGGEDLHPRNKLDVGHRLAAWALADVYDEKVVPSGPLFESFSIEGDKVRIKFKYAVGLKTNDGGPVKGFAVAGADHKLVWAEARIEGQTVVVWSPSISKPVTVRYGWADNPDVNLYNKAGLPASPFRTDDWPGITASSR